MEIVVIFKGRWFLLCYLIGSDEMDSDAHVGKVDQPEGLVEAEPSKEVTGSVISEGGVAEAAAEDVEKGGG